MGQIERVGKVPEAGSVPYHAVLCRQRQGCCGVTEMGSSRAKLQWDSDGVMRLPPRAWGCFPPGFSMLTGRAGPWSGLCAGGRLPTLNPDLQPHPALPQLLAPLV